MARKHGKTSGRRKSSKPGRVTANASRNGRSGPVGRSRAPSPKIVMLGAAVLLTGIGLVYRDALGEMARRWEADPQYSHGYLVPVLALGLVWLRRDRSKSGELRPSWFGLPVLTAGLLLWLFGTRYYFDWVEHVSIVVTVAGGVLLLGGRHAMRCAWPAVLLLAFMVPLPHRLEGVMQYPLRRAGTLASVYALQTLGMPAIAEGATISLNDARIGVAEACSGLRMLLIFSCLTFAWAFAARRPVWERLVIVASAVPIALFANVVRITATGALFAADHGAWAEKVFHDLAGWLMMPLALLLLAAESYVLTRLFVEDDHAPLAMDWRSDEGPGGLGPPVPSPTTSERAASVV